MRCLAGLDRLRTALRRRRPGLRVARGDDRLSPAQWLARRRYGRLWTAVRRLAGLRAALRGRGRLGAAVRCLTPQ
ncbi:hypothetical protein ACWED2_11540 [Amycolatopsis sp. NPDC005003]